MEHSGLAAVERAGDVRRPRDGAAPAWQEATVAAVVDEAPGAVAVRLELAEAAGFLPRQYYNVRLGVPGWGPRP